jgi:phenylpropionate dioxygenase-like ring-hydroxylating dioxygenase large terminal subunit
MRREVQEELITRLREMIDSGETTLVDSERYNPVAEYGSREHLATEHSELFRKFPIIVGHSSQLKEPRDYITDETSTVPVLVVRQEDGSLRAFFNVCRHRGVRVANEPCGNRRSFTCPYHGWTYGPEGSLKGIPHRQAFPDVDRDERGLVEIPVAERHGLIWVVLDPETELDIVEYLGADLDAELSSYGMSDFALERVKMFDESLNWKSVLDGFLENYHVRYLHADTLAKYVRTNVHTYDSLGRHLRLVVVKTRFDKVKDLPIEEYPHEPLYYMSPVYLLFPNTIIAWTGDHFETWTAFPDRDDPRRSLTRLSLIVPADRVEEHEFWDRSMQVILDVIPPEDFDMSRKLQSCLRAEAQEYQVFGRNEGAMQQFHSDLEDVLGQVGRV